MCSIGATFSNAVADIMLFLVVIFVLFVAFAMMFHVIFAFDMESFAGLGVALFSVLALPLVCIYDCVCLDIQRTAR